VSGDWREISRPVLISPIGISTGPIGIRSRTARCFGWFAQYV
jgi:hypothetical protein